MNLLFNYFLLLCMALPIFAIAQPSEKAPGFLGVQSSHVSKKKAKKLEYKNQYGRYITKVIENTPAEDIGLKPFDYITAVGEYELSENISFHDALVQYNEGDKVKIQYIRNRKAKSTMATLGNEDDVVRVKRNKKTEPFFGVQTSHTKKPMNVEGTRVDIVNNSTAQAMGLQSDDILQEINGYTIYDWQDVSTVIDNMKAGDMIKVSYYRDGEIYKDRMPIKSWNDTQINGHTSLAAKEETSIDMDMEDITKAEAKEMKKETGIDMPIVNDLKIDQLNLFPNPTNGFFNIRFELADQGETMIRVFDAGGRQVYLNNLGDYQGYFQDQIDISRNAKGVYFLEIRQGKKSISKKVILR